jgi:tetratricopeptide (TPR) repeat protein
LNALRRWIFLLLFGLPIWLPAQTVPAQAPTDQNLQQLAGAQRWNEIVSLLQPLTARTANSDYYFGIALAHLGRYAEAQIALEAGRSLAPTDARFSVELAGIAFKQKNYTRTARDLRQALRLAPHDAYTNDFLGTTYFLQGNLEASLKYWNRIGKPQIENVREDPTPRISPALLDHAFAFSPAATLTLPEFLDTNVRLRGLGVFPQFHFDLNALPDGNFNVVLRARELNGFGNGKLEALFLFFQGLPFQEVNPQFYNLHRETINFDSMFRWDAQKRRIFAQLSGPLEHSAKIRWNFDTDLRSENWAVRNGFAGPAPVLASFNLRSAVGGFNLASYAGDRFTWSAGAEISHRDFRSIVPGNVLTPQMLASGYELKQRAQVAGTLWRVPERRFVVSAQAASDAARLWSQPSQSFEKLTGSIGWHWFPQASGDDYETSQRLSAGKTFGQVPFDDLFILGLERDNDLPLRGHIGTRDGRKGSAPLGRNYLLENWELNKNLYGNGIVGLQLGPVFDIGKITDPGTSLGSHKWLFDTGAQLKVRVFSTGLVFTYGKDLRTGNNAFYVSALN